MLTQAQLVTKDSRGTSFASGNVIIGYPCQTDYSEDNSQLGGKKWGGNFNDKFNEDEIYALHKKQTEKVMRVVVALVVAVFAFTLYFLLTND